MTVKELIQCLEKHDPDKQVVVRGYEDGYNGVRKVKEISIVPHPQQENWYVGEYDEADNEEDMKGAIFAIELWGENRKSED